MNIKPRQKHANVEVTGSQIIINMSSTGTGNFIVCFLTLTNVNLMNDHFQRTSIFTLSTPSLLVSLSALQPDFTSFLCNHHFKQAVISLVGRGSI